MASNGHREMDLGEFDSLISKLRHGAQDNSTNPVQQQIQQTPPQYRNPSTSYPPPPALTSIPTTPLGLAQNQQPRSSSIMSPNTNEMSDRVVSQSNADRTASLLNLLKFSGPGSNPSAPISLPQTTSTSTEGRSSFGPAPPQASGNGRNTPGTDLMATLMGNSYAKPAQQPASQASQASSRVSSSSFRPQTSQPPQDTQNFLLQLLNRPKPSQNNSSASQDTITTPQSKNVPAPDIAGLSQALEQSTLENTTRAHAKAQVPLVFGSATSATGVPAKNLFTYENPFDELARSSPRNRTPKQATPAESSAAPPSMQILKHPRNNPSSDIGGYSRKSDERGRSDSPAYTKRKLESPIPVLEDGRTEIEALMGIGASNRGKETVSEALSGVGEKVNKQVEAAIEEAEKDEAQAEIEKDIADMMNAKNDKEFEATAQIAAQAIKKELDKDGNERVLQDSLTSPVANAVKELIEETAQGSVADNWENVDEDGTPKKESGPGVKVYNFPMRPFISITTSLPVEARASIRPDSAISIARLKKEFDQIDRTLVTATDTFMIYCMPKNGGIRIIHQGNGNNTKLFSNHEDRIFNIATSTAGEKEAVIGTGVSNTVYWAMMSQGDYDEDFVPETKSFSLPPSQTHDGESPGVLKTRARKSGSHTEFFAVGRGKCIHIIQPEVIMKDRFYFVDNRTDVVNTEKYLNDHGMVINTGKAGKDFAFSPDDTIIVSLDKSGKVKIWDVRPFTGKWSSSKNPVKVMTTGEIKEPVMTLNTTSPSEKSWATSVMFVDKVKPYQKGGPLRYLIIGMKQNHTLQLWDLALGRVVQEIHLPHEKESDAVCSVLYHPNTGIIIVGHPTRNSIYYIHLSAPKYGLSRMQNQAEYMEYLNSRDGSSARPDSTAVMSGIREFAFSTSEKGVLRSLEILQEPTSCTPNGTQPVLFELYAMHSKGITCLSVKQEDLGWSADNRVLYPVDAEKTGVIKVENLNASTSVQGSSAAPVNESNRGSPAAVHRPSTKDTAARDAGKKVSRSRDRADQGRSENMPTARAPAPITRAAEKSAARVNGSVPESGSSTEKSTRNRKKKNSAATGSPLALQTPTIEHPTILTRNGSSSKAQKLEVPESVPTAAIAETVMPRAPQPPIGMDQQAVDSVVNSLTPEIARIVQTSVQDLHRRIEEDKQIYAAAGDARQEAVLRLVSSSMADNVKQTQQSIERSVRHAVENKVLPTIIEVTSSTLSDQLGSTLSAQINKSLPKELQQVLPDAIFRVFQNPQLLKGLSDAVAGALIGQVESHLAATLQQSIMPSFAELITKTATGIAQDAQENAKAQMQSLAHLHQKDSAQIAQLTQLVTNLSNTVSTMAEAQRKFQEEMLKTQRQANSDRHTSYSDRNTPSVAQSVSQSVSQPVSQSLTRTPVQGNPQEDPQFARALEAVSVALQANELEAAVVAWLQSGREERIFEEFFSKLDNLDFIDRLSPLVLLSVGCVVTKDLVDFEPLKKLDWVEKIFQCFPVQPGYYVQIDDRIRAVLPNTMMVIETRLEDQYNRINHESRGRSPLLHKLAGLLNFAQRIRSIYGLPGSK